MAELGGVGWRALWSSRSWSNAGLPTTITDSSHAHAVRSKRRAVADPYTGHTCSAKPESSEEQNGDAGMRGASDVDGAASANDDDDEEEDGLAVGAAARSLSERTSPVACCS